MGNRRTDEISITQISQKPVSLVCSPQRKHCCVQWCLSWAINLERCCSFLPGEAFYGPVWAGHHFYPLLTSAEHIRVDWNVYFWKPHFSEAGAIQSILQHYSEMVNFMVCVWISKPIDFLCAGIPSEWHLSAQSRHNYWRAPRQHTFSLETCCI